MQKVYALWVCLLLVGISNAQVITVDDDGTADYTTIQAAIDASGNGDIVVVCPGTYTGTDNYNINFGGRAITVRSTDPKDPAVVAATVIDCGYLGRGFDFNNSEGPDSIINGFTIVNAEDTDLDYEGGAIRCDGSSPTIANCNILNSLGYIGGAVCNENSSSPALINCIFTNNESPYGGGIFNSGYSDPNVINCTFTGNLAVGAPDSAGGGIYNDNSNPTIINCIFSGNYAYDDGGGICSDFNCGASIINCTFSGNTADAMYSGGGGGALLNNGGSNTTVGNCILWDNEPDEIYLVSGTVTVDYSNVQDGYPGTGNINEDPLFIDADGPDDIVGTEDDNLRLLSSSPCIDAGDSRAVGADTADIDEDGGAAEQIPRDIDGNLRLMDDPNTADEGATHRSIPIVDMGAYESSGLTMVGDFEPDGDVDLDDLAVIVVRWLDLGCGDCGGADLSGDGSVNLADFAKFAQTGLVGGGESHKPVFAPIGNKLLTENENLNFTVSATDPDYDTLDYSAFNLPSDELFDTGTQVFDWTPTTGQAGQYFVTFYVSDGIEVDSETVTITVNPEPVTVPDVVDTTQASAEAAIVAAGLVVGDVTTSYDPVIVAGNVISQDPAAGASVLPGTSVDLVVSLGPEPVGHWAMDDNAANKVVEDSSFNGNHGTAQQNTEDIADAGIIDGALTFNGTTDYIDCGNDTSLDITGSVSISAWVKFDALSTDHQTIVAKRGAVEDQVANYVLRTGPGQIQDQIQFYYHDGTNWHVYTASNANLLAGQWYHIATTFTFGTGSSMKCYVNNNLLTGNWNLGDGNSPVPINTKPVTIGGLTTGKYLDGIIDNVKIFNKALSEGQIEELYNEGGA